MYFLTALDPNYTIKGSRDPLGFQILWQSAGRKLIPNLSTVSASIIDFQILSLAQAIKIEKKIPDEQFEQFFMRFEQLMAYTRYLIYPEKGFNGIDKVRKVLNNNTNSIFVANTKPLLSNQKAYGIWGKYIRPYKDMKINDHESFLKIHKDKLDVNVKFSKEIESILSFPSKEIRVSDLLSYSSVLQKPVSIEKSLYTDKLLEDKCGNILRKVIPEINTAGTLYNLIEKISIAVNDEILSNVLSHIYNTEQVLSPLNRIFRYIQTKNSWTFNEIETDTFITNWRTSPVCDSFDNTMQGLANLLSLTNVELVKGLIIRNQEITGRRNGAPWIKVTDTRIEVNHREGGFFHQRYDPELHNDYNYFLNTYVNIYNQLN